jgi:hypothetical protein
MMVQDKEATVQISKVILLCTIQKDALIIMIIKKTEEDHLVLTQVKCVPILLVAQLIINVFILEKIA